MRREMTSLTHLLLSFFVLAPVALHLPPAGAQTKRAGKEVYRGNITYIGGPRGSVTDFFTLTINNYTAEADVNRLTDLLKREGQDGFWKAVEKEKRGTIQLGSGNEARSTIR